MSAEITPPFPSSAVVLRICLMIKDVVAALTSNQDILHRHHDTVQELMSLDRALLEVELSSKTDILSTIKEKSAETIEQSRQYLVAFLEKCRLDPIFGADENQNLPASFDSELLPETKYMEDLRSAINGFCKDLNALLAVEIGTVPLEAPISSIENPSSENLWPYLSPTSSLALEDEETAENLRLAQLLTNDFDFGESQYPEIVTSGYKNDDIVAPLADNQTPERTWTSPTVSLHDIEQNDELPGTSDDRLPWPRKRKASSPGNTGSTPEKPPRDANSARDHPLYQDVSTGPDGLYHCPWEGKDLSCCHQPAKHRCKYDKYVDAHLKPYRCKVEICKGALFASKEILTRHEKEAHRMHGIGDRLNLCPAQGCERGLPDQGFPRHWNLVDHMKRIHNCSPTTHKANGCTEFCDGSSFKIATKKEKFVASTVEAGISALQSEFDPVPNENSTISGVPTASGLRPGKKTKQNIPKPARSRPPAKKPRKARARKLRYHI